MSRVESRSRKNFGKSPEGSWRGKFGVRLTSPGWYI